MSKELNLLSRKIEKNMERESELEDLCIVLKENILSRVSLKPRTRLKCVSKNWCDIINGLRRFIRPTSTPSVFVILEDLRNSGNQTAAIRESHSHHCQIPRNCTNLFRLLSPRTSPAPTERFQQWLASLHRAYRSHFYIFSPIPNNWCRPIPPGPHTFSIPDSAKMAFEGSQAHLKVIHHLGNKPDCRQLHCLIFSSETFQWRAVKFRSFNLKFWIQFHPFRHSHSLFIKGKLYGTWSADTHDVERGVFKLPDVKSTEHVLSEHKILWESEGHIYCCQLDSDGFHIWSCIDDDDIDKVDEDGNGNVHCELKRLFKQSFMLKELELQSAEMVGLEEEEREHIIWTLDFIGLLGFNNYELQMYPELPHLILSYSFETRKLAKVWSYDYPFTILPFPFNPLLFAFMGWML